MKEWREPSAGLRDKKLDKKQNFFVMENLYTFEGFLIESFVERPSASKRSWEFVLHVQLLLVKQLRDELQFCFSSEMLC